MAKSLGLALYLLAVSRGAVMATGGAANLPEPPEGSPLVWLHAPDGEVLGPLAALACRLHAARAGLGLILTHPEGRAPAPDSLPDGCLSLASLPDDAGMVRRALSRWGPKVLVIGGGSLQPAMIHETYAAGVSTFLVDAGAPTVDRAWPLWPGLQRALLRRMRRILVRDAAALRAFRRAGARDAQLEEVGAMSLSRGALACNMAEREALGRRLGVRPVWLAAAVPETEEAMVLEAQAAASGMAHRLLLVLVPADPARGPALADLARDKGLRVARRAAEEEPADEDQIYIADTEDEFGLWYRLATITFMGGTVTGERTGAQSGSQDGGAGTDTPAQIAGRDPFEPAALGSAIVHGPHTKAHDAAYGSLDQARAACRVTDAASLTAAVSDLLAPDRAALLARAGWGVATQGAEATDRAIELVLAALDEARR